MNALSRIYAALRPRGLLLDLQEATHAWVEVGVGGAILSIGHLHERQDIQDIHIMLTGRQAAIDAGQFVLERETRFTFVEHFDTVESWLTYRAEHEQGAAIPAEVVARARALLPPGTAGEVRISSEVSAARLQRFSITSWSRC